MTKKPKKKHKTITHAVRTRDEKTKTIKRYGRKLAMALFCTECMGFESDPATCTDKLCPLYPWRVRTQVSNTGDNRSAF